MLGLKLNHVSKRGHCALQDISEWLSWLILRMLWPGSNYRHECEQHFMGWWPYATLNIDRRLTGMLKSVKHLLLLVGPTSNKDKTKIMVIPKNTPDVPFSEHPNWKRQRIYLSGLPNFEQWQYESHDHRSTFKGRQNDQRDFMRDKHEQQCWCPIGYKPFRQTDCAHITVCLSHLVNSYSAQFTVSETNTRKQKHAKNSVGNFKENLRKIDWFWVRPAGWQTWPKYHTKDPNSCQTH